MEGLTIEIPFNAPLSICKGCDLIEPDVENQSIYGDDKKIHRDLKVTCRNELMCRYISKRVKEEMKK